MLVKQVYPADAFRVLVNFPLTESIEYIGSYVDNARTFVGPPADKKTASLYVPYPFSVQLISRTSKRSNNNRTSLRSGITSFISWWYNLTTVHYLTESTT